MVRSKVLWIVRFGVVLFHRFWVYGSFDFCLLEQQICPLPSTLLFSWSEKALTGAKNY
jgi:hypothetical protein